jgi:hypothetical protein
METGPQPSELLHQNCPGAKEESLEQGEIIYFPVCPFSWSVTAADHQFLLEQRLHGPHKSISLDPVTGRSSGLRHKNPGQGQRLRGLLAAFAQRAAAWLARALPRYAGHIRPDRVNLHPDEEATRRVRQNARNDLLHVDAFPSRPTGGRRILRLFVNINPTEPRIWVTSEAFPGLLDRYGREVGFPLAGEDSWTWQVSRTVLGLFRRGQPVSVYDHFMRRFHDFLKRNEAFQERCRKRFWTFPPGSAWLAFTDTVSYGVLRGQHALDYTAFVAAEALALPELSPPLLLQRACGLPVCRRAA